MNIVLLAAGAGSMYCGSCLRDNALAAAMSRAGGDRTVRLLPMHTPLTTDEPDVSEGGIFYGGVNIYLQQVSPLFRHTPRLCDWSLDRKALLRWAGRFVGSASPTKLGAMTVSILRGRRGRQRKELRRLLDHLTKGERPDVVVLPNAMFLGLAEPIKRETGAKVICELTGEDAFLDGLAQPYRAQARTLIREAVGHADGLIATSEYYADTMAGYLAVDRGRIDVVLGGINPEGLAPAEPEPHRPPTIAYMARICPEKGLDLLVEALISLRKRTGFALARVIVGGFIPRKGPDREWFEKVRTRATDALRPGAFEYVGTVDREGKCELLNRCDVLCVPATRPEAKGVYVLEGFACGLPFVGFDHGALPELLDAAAANGTRPGALSEPGRAEPLADALAEVLGDRKRRAELGQIGRRAVETNLSADRMAAETLAVIDRIVADQ